MVLQWLGQSSDLNLTEMLANISVRHVNRHVQLKSIK